MMYQAIDEKTKSAVLAAHGLKGIAFADSVYDGILMSLITEHLESLQDAADVESYLQDKANGTVELLPMDELLKEYGV